MPNILFITSTRIGDAILSMGLIDHILKTYPNPQLTIVCGSLPKSLFEGMPHLDELIVLKKEKYHKHWWGLWRRLRKKKWDVIVDLRDSIISRVLPAKEKYIFSKHINRKAHKVVQNAEVMKLNDVPSPKLYISDAQNKFADNIMGRDDRKIIGIGPTANWIGKTWPIERFIELAHYLTSHNGPFPDARVAVFAAPGEEGPAIELLNTIPVDQRIDVIAKGNPGEAAACLARCDFYVGNDSGLMHAAAAAGVPTCGLFGASYVSIYGPYGARVTYAHTPESYDELANYEGYSSRTLTQSLMTSLTTSDVIRTIDAFLKRN